MDVFLQDLRYGARHLKRNPLFALTAALSLGIGIGATTSVFTIANALLFRAPAGVAAPGNLVDITPMEAGRFGITLSSYTDYLAIRQRATTLDGVYAYQLELEPMNLRGPNGAERVFGTFVSHTYFSVLGVPAAAGRLFGITDGEQPGASPLIVLSYRFWERRFNKSADIVGRTLLLNGQALTVLGVAGQGFQGSSVVAADAWIPVSMVTTLRPGTLRLTGREPWLMIGARLKPDLSIAQAGAEIDSIGRVLDRDRPRRDIFTPGGARIETGPTRLEVARSSPIPAALRLLIAAFLALLMGIVAIVLVIACANLAGVLLSRATTRRREIAVRAAIGANRSRLIQQLLTETSLLFVLGGAGGLLLARGLLATLRLALPAFPVPVDVSLPLDGRVVAFSFALSFLAALFSGLAPALHASRADVVSALKDDSQGPSDRFRLRNAFVIGQVAFSLVLIVCAGLLIRALDRVGSVDSGFDAKGIELATIDLSLAGYTSVTGPAFTGEVLDRVRRLPRVEHVTIASMVPSRMLRGMTLRLSVPGVTPPPAQEFFQAFYTAVAPDYFATLRLPIVSGRDFTDGDSATSQRVAIVSESTARRLWPGRDAVGKTVVVVPMVPPGAPNPPRPTPMVVVGVADDLKYRDPDVGAPLTVYLPLQQRYASTIHILMRTTGGRRLGGELRESVASVDPNLPPIFPETLDEHMTGPVELQLRLAASAAAGVGIVGLLLAAMGIYGVTAHAAALRTREIGIRVALGAERADVVSMIVWKGLSLVVIGTGLGLLLAAAGSRLLTGLLFGLRPMDALTFAGAAVLFAAVGLAASYLPARRAVRIKPVDALRYE